MESKQLKELFFISVFTTVSVFGAFSQQNFTPLKRGDYTIKEQKSDIVNNIKVNGYYNAFWGVKSIGAAPEFNSSGTTGQDIKLQIQSKINYDVSLNISFRNQFSNLNQQKDGYSYHDPNDIGDNSSDAGMNVVFDEAYLEYNHNPNAILRIGRQFINLADKKGFIYQGTATALSQKCRIGTWCYYIGGANLSDSGDALYWVQLDYPVFESGELVENLWSEAPRQKNSLNVELFRVMHVGQDVPLAKYGGSTGENSIYHETDSGDYVYFDNQDVEYFGANIKWIKDVLSLDVTLISLTGKRRYHKGTRVLSNVSDLKTNLIGGSLFYGSLDYQYLPEWRLEVAALLASGEKLKDSEAKIWEQNSAAFVEVQKGDHGNALVYFNGKNNLGDGHSVSNLKYEKIGFSYRSLERDFSFDIHLYSFQHVVDVYTETGQKEKAIGREVDVRLGWKIKRNFRFDMFWGIFSADNAYSENDNILPTSSQSDQSLFGYELKYIF